MGSRDRMLELPLPLRRWLGPVYSTPLASFGLLGGEALLCALIIRKVACALRKVA